MCECLTDPRFEVITDSKGAEGCDVWWATPHIKDFNQFISSHPKAICGQMPNQKNLVCKVS